VGVDAVAIDFFARTAPSDDRSDSFDFMAQVPQTKPDALQADIAAAVAYLRGKDGGEVRSVFSVGFCFGGALSYLQAASGLGYAGVIGFYGWPLGLARWPDRPKPIDAVARYRCSVLSLFGGADQGIPQGAVDEFDAACARPASSMTRPSIRERRTASSTASRPSSQRPRRMPGSACRRSSARTPNCSRAASGGPGVGARAALPCS